MSYLPSIRLTRRISFPDAITLPYAKASTLVQEHLLPYLKNLKALLTLAWEEDRMLVTLYFTSSLLGALLMYVVYFVYKDMIDYVMTASQTTMGSALFVTFITYLFFEYLSRFVTYTFNQYYFDFFIRAKLQNALTRRFMDKLASLDFAHLENGEVRNLIAKIENTYGFRLPEILNRVNAIVYNIAALIFSLLIAMQFSIWYFLLLGIVSAPVYYLRAKYGNIAWSSYSTNATNMNYLWYLRSLFTNFQTLSEMKIYGLKPHFLKQTKTIQQKVLADYQKPIATYTMLSTMSFVLIPIAIFFAINHFMKGITAEIYTIGDFTFFLNALFTFSGQISSLLVNVGSLSENSLYLSDFFTLMNMENVITTPAKPHVFKEIQPKTITFENVSFTYPGASRPSLSNVSFTIKKGENVAIVGSNGAGKSTLIKLLFRFYDPDEGRILVDGVDLREIALDNWYKHIGVLFQDFARYCMTLEDNIKFGRLDKDSRLEVENALYKSQGKDLLKNLPKGYEQILGRWFDGGLELSGGQWQKVAIARAIFRGAPVLIMDEPTSAIDADAEAEIFKNLHELYKDKNLIFISHRFSTVRMADTIYVLSKGEIIEQGSHHSLLRKNGLYKNLFSLQKRGYE